MILYIDENVIFLDDMGIDMQIFHWPAEFGVNFKPFLIIWTIRLVIENNRFLQTGS